MTGLEALGLLIKILKENDWLEVFEEETKQCKEVIKQDLKEHEELKNELNEIKQIFNNYELEYKLTYLCEALLLLKQYQGTYGESGQKTITDKLKEHEDFKKGLDIIKKKIVDIHDLINSNNLEDYNYKVHWLGFKGNLTEEEFNLLKGLFKWEQ